jgi:cytochrome c peroxidase
VKRVLRYLIYFSAAFLFCCSFVYENPFFKIEEKDVALHVPKGFPKPLYEFKNNKLSPAVFVLGRKLFYDAILSKDNTISCATCHQRFAAFAHIDHRLSHGIYAKIGNRNVPALQNLIWKDSYQWDGGVNHLEVQPVNPITNPIEMDESLVNVIAKLRKSSAYRELFREAYHDTLICSERLLKSLAQFTGLMISCNSRYDHYLAGTDTFSASEKRGLRLFRSRCSSCHKEPLLSDNSYCNNGLQADTSLNDKGREVITGLRKDRNCFKVPGLRNVQMTYPYMHDGRFKKLEDVLAHYTDAANFAKEADVRLLKIGKLSEENKKDLLDFLLTLSDKTFLYDRRFADPGMY